MMNTPYIRNPVKTAVLVFFEALLVVSCAHTPPAGGTRVTKITDPNPIPLGTAELQMENFPAGLKGNEAEAYYYAQDDLVALEIGYQLVTYRQFWDEPARKMLLDALSLYQDDYASGNFPAKGAKARHAYGSTRGITEWQQLPFLKVLRVFKVFPKFDLGYSLKGTSSYFTIIQNKAPEVNYPAEEIVSPQLTLYFTPGQAQALAALFKELPKGE
jgi:hypothetical protein